MKKIMTVVLLLVGMSTLKGQQKIEPAGAAASKFNEQFKGATNVKWTKAGDLFAADFNLDQTLRIAYYDSEGNLIARGRKIKDAQLPMDLYDNLQAVKQQWSQKMGALQVGSIYELSQKGEGTEYVTTLENDQIVMTLVSVQGTMSIRKKVKKNSIAPSQDLIAKAPQQ